MAYKSGPDGQQGEQLYEVDMYGFVPEQLTASETGVYSHLQQVVRLHTPQARPPPALVQCAQAETFHNAPPLPAAAAADGPPAPRPIGVWGFTGLGPKQF